MSADLTAAELDAARVELFGFRLGTDEAGFRYRLALGRLADALYWHEAFPDERTAARVRAGRAMAAALDADDPGRVSLAIWTVTDAGPSWGPLEQRRARLAELRAAKAADLARAEHHATDGPDDVRGFWAGRVVTLTDELARIDTALTPDSAVPSSLSRTPTTAPKGAAP